MQELCRQLVISSVQTRSENTQITRHFSARNAIEAVLGTKIIAQAAVEEIGQSTSSDRDASGRKKSTQETATYVPHADQPVRHALSAVNQYVVYIQ